MLNPIKFLLNIPQLISVISYLLYIAYLSFNISKGKGIFLVNAILLAVTLVFLVIYVILWAVNKKNLKRAKRYFKWFKLAMKGISFAIIAYGFFNAWASEESTAVMPTILIILWIIQINGEIRRYKARKRREKMKERVGKFTSLFKKKQPESEDDELGEEFRELDARIARRGKASRASGGEELGEEFRELDARIARRGKASRASEYAEELTVEYTDRVTLGDDE